MPYTDQEKIISALSKLTMEMDGAEFGLLRPVIDKEMELENSGFKGSDEELFYKAISKIGVPEIRKMVPEYNKRMDAIRSKITVLENKYDSLSPVSVNKKY